MFSFAVVAYYTYCTIHDLLLEQNSFQMAYMASKHVDKSTLNTSDSAQVQAIPFQVVISHFFHTIHLESPSSHKTLHTSDPSPPTTKAGSFQGQKLKCRIRNVVQVIQCSNKCSDLS